MILKEKVTEIGVIIGRFQINKLHDAHVELIQTVINNHEKVILFLGVSQAIGTKRNPMDFITRKVMLEQTFPTGISIILPLLDKKSDVVWSHQVDSKIREVFPSGNVTIYGSRDSCLTSYSGLFQKVELIPNIYTSATFFRENISKKIMSSDEFRAGIIYSVYSQYPTVYSTVDIAILNSKNEVLLGQKPDENLWRFIGGFVDISDESDEAAAKREAYEETGLEIDNLNYLGSYPISDWRYKGSKDKSIMTRFFSAKYIFGTPTPQDDIAKLKWFPISEHLSDILVLEHIKLFNKLLCA